METANTTEKTCNACKQTKPIQEFYRKGGGKPGHRCRCKMCENTANNQAKFEKRERLAVPSSCFPDLLTSRTYRHARDHRGDKWYCLVDVLRALDYKGYDRNGPNYVASKLPSRTVRKMPIMRRSPRRPDRVSLFLMLCVNAEGKALIEERARMYHCTVWPALRGQITPLTAFPQ